MDNIIDQFPEEEIIEIDTNSEIEEELEEKYGLTRGIIYSQNKRAIKNKKIGILTAEEFQDSIEWWKKHGLDEQGNLVKDGILRDPYTGLPVTNNSKTPEGIVLEHIIPIDLGGCTALFNCLPSRGDINNQKSANDPLEWWINSTYWNEKRFEVFTDYLFWAYDKMLKENKLTKETFITTSDFYQNSEEELSIEEIEENSKRAVGDIPQQEISSIPRKEILYDEFLVHCVNTLKEINPSKAAKYEKKLTSYQELFATLNKHQYVLTYLYKVLDNLDSSIKYKIIRYINMNILSKSLEKVENLEIELFDRINYINECLKNDSSNISLSDLLYKVPNILTMDKNTLNQKLFILQNAFTNSNSIITILIKNPQLLLIPNHQINDYLTSLKNYIPEYFELFINNNLYYESIYLIHYIEKAEILDYNLLKEETNSLKSEKKLQQLKSFNSSFKSTLNIRLSSTSSIYSIDKKQINPGNFTDITNYLYNKIDFMNNPTEEVIKSKLKEKIDTISDEDLLNGFKLEGENEQERRNNLLEYMYSKVDDGTIQTYLTLEKIYETKKYRLSKEQYQDALTILKERINACNTTQELMDLITSETYQNLQRLNSFRGSFKNTLNISLSSTSGTYSLDKKQINSGNFTDITNYLYNKIDFVNNPTEEVIKSKLKEKIDMISDEDLLNGFNLKGENEQERRNNLLEYMYSKVDDVTIQTYLTLEKIYETKKYRLSKEQYQDALTILKERINACNTTQELMDLVTSETYQNLQRLNSFQGSFKNTLNINLKSTSGTYSLDKKQINAGNFTEITNCLYNKIDFMNNPTDEVIKSKLKEKIDTISDEDLLNAFKLEGESEQERRDNLLEYMYSKVDDGTIQTYLTLEKIYEIKKEKINILEKTIKDKLSKEQYQKSLVILKERINAWNTTKELMDLVTSETYQNLQRLNSFNSSFKNTLNTSLSNTSGTYSLDKKHINSGNFTEITNYLYNKIDFMNNPTDEVIKSKLKEKIDMISDEDLLNDFKLEGENEQKRRNNLLEYMYSKVDDGTIQTYLTLEKIYQIKTNKLSKEHYRNALTILKERINACNTTQELRNLVTSETYQNLQQLNSFQGSFKTTLNKSLTSTSRTYSLDKKGINPGNFTDITNYLYNKIDFMNNPTDEVIKSKLKEKIDMISDEELLNGFRLEGENEQERRNNLLEYMYSKVDDGTIQTYLELQEIYNQKLIILNPKEKFLKEKSILCDMFGIPKEDKDIKRIPYLELKYKLIFLITNQQPVLIDGKINPYLFRKDTGETEELINRHSNIEQSKGRSA